MDAKIDYLSFTTPARLSGAGHSDHAWYVLVETLIAAGHLTLCQFLGGRDMEPRKGRAHYGAGLYFQSEHISVWFGGIANHILVEIAGVGCQALRDAGVFDEVVAAAGHRATRLDVAVDFVWSGFPDEFVAAGYNERFKTRASMISSTGKTEYVGGLKSARFARVYKYAPPHPRAGVLRVEMVLRDEYAKNGAALLLEQGLGALVGACGASWGWKHELWQPDDVTAGKLRSKRHDTHGAGTVRWLYLAVLPALVRASRDGLVSLPEFFDDVLQKLDKHVNDESDEGGS